MGRLSATRYLFDECVTANVPEALHSVGFKGITHLRNVGLLGAADVTIAKMCSSGGQILVTRDRKQLVNLDEFTALKNGLVRAVFLPSALATYTPWRTLQWFARHWDEIDVQASALNPGQILLVDLRGKIKLFDDVLAAAKVHARRAQADKRRKARATFSSQR